MTMQLKMQEIFLDKKGARAMKNSPANNRLGEDVLKTYWRRYKCNIFLSSKISSSSLENVLKIQLQDVILRTSWRYLRSTPWRPLEGVVKTSWKRLEDVLRRCLEYVFIRRLWRRLMKTYSKNCYAKGVLENKKCLQGEYLEILRIILSMKKKKIIINQ